MNEKQVVELKSIIKGFKEEFPESILNPLADDITPWASLYTYFSGKVIGNKNTVFKNETGNIYNPVSEVIYSIRKRIDPQHWKTPRDNMQETVNIFKNILEN